MKKIEIKDLLDFKFVSAPSFSPDGKYAAFVVQTTSLEDNKYYGDIWLLDVASKDVRQLTFYGDVKSFEWTKYGTILYPGVRENKLNEKIKAGEELSCWYEISPDDGQESLAFTLPLFANRVSPIDNDRYIVTAKFDNNRPDMSSMNEAERMKTLEMLKNKSYEAFEEAPFWENGAGFTAGKRTRIYIYTRSSDKLTTVTPPLFNTHSYSLFGTKLLYGGVEWSNVKRFHDYPGLWIYDIETGKQRCVLKQGTIHNNTAVLKKNDTALIAATTMEPFGAYQYKDFYELDINTGNLVLLKKYGESIGENAVNTDAALGGNRTTKQIDGKFYFLTTIDDSCYLKYIDDNGDLSDNLTPRGSCSGFDVYGKHLLVCAMYGTKLAELYLDGEQVTFFNDKWTDEHSVVAPEYHTFTDADGFEIHGWALKPVGYQKNRKYPAILHIHGGPRTAFGQGYHHEMQMWANAGYFVFYCNPRGSEGRGDEFGDIRGKFGTVDYQNLMQFADEMLEKYPDANPEKFAVIGGSYGGFMTNWIIGHTDRFAVAVSQRSYANWINFEYVSDIGMWYVKNNNTVNTCEDVEKLWNHSPLKYAHKCKTPTLFIHSDADYRCNLTEGISMFTALKNSGCEARICIFKGENHELSRSGKPNNRIYRMEEILGWLDKHLK